MPLLDRDPPKLITHSLNYAEWGHHKVKWLDYWLINKTAVGDDKQTIDHDSMKNLVTLGYAKDPADIKVRRLPIRVDSDDIDDFLKQDYVLRGKKPRRDREGKEIPGKHDVFIACQGDGVNASRLQGDGTFAAIPCTSRPEWNGKGFRERSQTELHAILSKQKKHDPHDGLRCPYAQNSDPKKGPCCKPETVLTCRCDAIGSLGTFARYRSHSHKTADRLRSSFEEIKAKLGFLADVPLDLVLEKVMMNTPFGRTALPVCHVVLRVTADEALRLTEARLRARAQIEDRKRLLLTAHREQDNPEQIAQEFLQDVKVVKTTAFAEGNGVVVDGQHGKPIEAKQPDLIDVPSSFDPAVDGDR